MVLPAELLRSYVPGLLASCFVARPTPLDAPGVERFSAAVLFADVSGFTPLAEQLARRGPTGAEALSNLLNDYFAKLTTLVAEHGGEVIAFAGDGLLAVWPATDMDGDLATATCDAGRCALAVQSALHGYQTVDGLRLLLRVGVGAGEVMALRVGGDGGRWQLLLSGAPVVQGGLAEQQAARGEVVLSPEAWALANDGWTGERLADGGVRLLTAGTSLEVGARSRATQELGDDVVQAYVPDVVRARLAAGQAEWLAELRRITAVFVNLVDVDPAAASLLEPVQLALAAIQPILQRHEGSLKQVVVDDKGLTLIAVFGLPLLAHEDDPARATRAALGVHAALDGLGLGCAIGLATGRAFCGAVGGDVHREYDVIGEVMNLAARLMQAVGDGILCDAATYQAAQAQLRFRALPTILVKGKTDPVAVYRPIGQARKVDGPTAMLGRTEERATLAERLGALEDGTAALVVVEGEPGIGKSRLLADLLEQAQARGVRSLSGAGDAIEQSTPYHAWRPIFTQLIGLGGAGDIEERRAIVLAHVQADPALARLVPLLDSVLPLELPDNELTAQLTGEVRAANTRELLVRLLQAAATGPGGGTSPLLLVLDDAHWFDSASWALTRQVVAQVRPLLLVLATRPLVEPLPDDYRRLGQDPATERLQLEPLSPHDVLTLVCDRLGVRRLPEAVAALIEERAQGNPFFSEELAYALRDTGLIHVRDGTCTIPPGAGDLSAMSFPDTMQGVVAARIDRLAPGQELTLKVASVIGRLFALRILRDIHPIEPDRSGLREYLEDLARQDFTVLDTPEPDLAYLFKHIVTQEVAYGLLLSSQRRQLHRAVAEWYEQGQADDRVSLYPLLAYHWGRADEPTKTLGYLELAGEQALLAGAYQEAVDFLGDALSLAESIQPAADVPRQARWHRQLGDAYMGLGRLPESRRHADQAVALLGAPVPATPLRLLGDLGRQALQQSLHRVWPARLVRGTPAARTAALEATRAFERLGFLNYYANARAPGISAVLHAVNLAERAGPSPELARAYASMSVAAGVVQLHALARSYARKALQIARAEHDQPAVAFVLVATSTYHNSVGNWTTAQEGLLEGLGIAQRLGDQRRWGELAAGRAVGMYFQGQFDHLAAWQAEMQEMASHADDPQRQAHAILGKIWYLMPQGRTDIAIKELQEATRLLAGRGSRADEIVIYGVLALAHLRRQDTEQARLAAHRAASLIAQSRPTAAYTLEGYAGVTEVYLDLWMAGDHAAARPAQQARAALRRLARTFPTARPRAWLYEGLVANHLRRRRRAVAAWTKSLKTAERLAMPYEQGRAHYELGRHLPPGHPARQEHLSRAWEIFTGIGASYELTQVRAAMSP
jgi:predicted ATPase/class 3 adenylate cyclase